MEDERQDFRKEVELLEALHSQPATAIYGLLTSVAALFMAALNTGDWRFLLPSILLVPFGLYRLAQMYTFRKEGADPRFVQRWKRTFFVCSVMIALAHGLFVLQAMLLTDQTFTISLAVGICLAQMIGVVARNFASSSLVNAQAVAMAVPSAVGWWLHTDPWFGVTAIFFLPFFLSARSLASGIRNLLEGQREALETIRRVAVRDSLTGLLNRKGFYDLLAQEARQSDRGQYIAVLVDVDQFKAVNDTYGHSVGDALLVQIALRLRELEKEYVHVARLAGDEFVIFGRSDTPRETMEQIGERIEECFADRFNCRGVHLSMTASIGAAAKPTLDDSEPSVLICADLALYEVKEQGRAGFRIYRDEMQSRFERREMLKRDLRKAAAAGQFELMYQPIADVRDGRISSCEALIRWRHPSLGTISPDEFIPFAESMNVIGEITRWAIDTAVAECVNWPAEVGVAVNLSANDLRDRSIVNTVFDILIRRGLAANRLILEMTETALVEEPVMTQQVLHGLKTLGVQIALDDFGTGYANFAYLIDYEFDKLKLDRSLTRQVAEAPRGRTLIAGLARTAQELGIAVIAEGVETAKQLQTLRELDCVDRVQGYLLSRPIPAGEPIRERLADPYFKLDETSEKIARLPVRQGHTA